MTTADRLKRIEAVLGICRGSRVNLDINEASWLVARIRKLEAAVNDVAKSGIEGETAKYVTIQIARETWDEIRALCEQP